MSTRPSRLIDIKHGATTPFSVTDKVVSLMPRSVRLPFFRPLKVGLLALVATYLVIGLVVAPNSGSHASFAATTGAERVELEQQLTDLESQMAEYEATIAEYKKQGTTLKSEISKLTAQASKINLQIKALNLTLEKLDDDIVDNRKEITTTEAKLALNLDAISDSLQGVYESERVSLVAVLLKNPNLSDFFNDINNLLDVQSSLTDTVAKINILKEELLSEKESLAIKFSDAAAAKAYQDQQRKALADAKAKKDSLLVTTKGQESKYQEILKQTQKTAAEIRSRIFEFLGGGEMTFDQAYQFAKMAEKATGIRAALTLAILDRESALGQNVGRCKYNEISTLYGKTVMHPTRDIPVFLEITKALDINPDTVTVSCPNRDGTYGGAMGPAQFIPATWKLFESKISTITGSNPPSPWRNGDAIVATALYLKDALVRTGSERNAAANYYCGGNWKRSVCLNVYGKKVIDQAALFQQDIDVLNI